MTQPMTSAQWRAFVSHGTRTGKIATVRAGGAPHVVPIWFVLDGDDVVFTTGSTSVKGRRLVADGRAAICVDKEEPPYAFVMVRGPVTISEDPAELKRWATAIAARYMGEALAEQYGDRNSTPGELLVRMRVAQVSGYSGVAN